MIDVECPGCGSSSFDDSIDVVDGFCENCGAVIPDAENTDDLPSFPEYDAVDELDAADSIPESWTEWYDVTNSTEQQVATAIEYLERISDSIRHSNETRTRAAELYCEASLDLATDGRPTDTTVAALLYLAARDTDEPRPATAYTQEIEREDAEIKSLARSLQRELELELPIPDPSNYLPYLSEELDLGEEIFENATNVLNSVIQNGGMGGKNPVSIAGAAVYKVDDHHTQREISQVAGVTKETIRKRLNELEDQVGENEFFGKGEIQNE